MCQLILIQAILGSDFEKCSLGSFGESGGLTTYPLCVCQSSGLLLKPQSPGEGVGLCLVTSSSGGGPPCPPILEQINLIAKAFRLTGPVIRTCTCGRCVCKEWALRFLQGCSLVRSLSLLWPAVLMGSMFSSTRLKCKVSSHSNSVSGPGLPGFCLHCP